MSVTRRSTPGILAGALLWASACAQEESPQPAPPTAPMTGERLDRLIGRIDEDAQRLAPSQWQFTVADRALVVIIDEAADRMRVVTPIVEAKLVDDELFRRMLQANYDSALDARYAVAQGVVWSVFIHPLGELTDRFFLSGVGQVVNAADTFGTTFSSGVLLFGGGDSGQLQRKLLDDLEKLLEKHRT